MSLKLILPLLLLVVTVIGFFILSSNNSQKTTPQATTSPSPTSQIQKETDFEASFAIFTNGTFRIFTAPMYHNLSENVYIESSNPNIVYVKKAGITWTNFFRTLPMELTKDCLTTGTGQIFCTNDTHSLKFYINGQAEDDALNKTIQPGDKLLVSYGIKNDPEIKNQLNQIP